MNAQQKMIELAIVLRAIELDTEDLSIAAACSNVLIRCGVYSPLPMQAVKKVRGIIHTVKDIADQWEEIDTIAERWSIKDETGPS